MNSSDQKLSAVAVGSTGGSADTLTTYQPQHEWSDGTFSGWTDIGPPTRSKCAVRSRLRVYISLHPNEKVQVLRIVSRAEVADIGEFLPNK